MPQEYIKQHLRDSTDTDFYHESEDFLNYVKINYIDTGKCLIFRERSFFDDEELVLISRSVWRDDECSQEFINDPMTAIDVENSIAYNTDHKIKLLDIIINDITP
jgi:hypothetical protein